MDKKLTPFEFCGELYNLAVRYSRYTYSNSLAVRLINLDDGESFGMATVALPESVCLDDDMQFVDTNNLPNIANWLIENGLAKRTSRKGYSGFCTYPAMRFLNVPKMED